MNKDIGINRLLDLPRDASPEEIEQQCEALLDWLDSDGVPNDIQSWASNLRDVVQEIYEGLGVLSGQQAEVVEAPASVKKESEKAPSSKGAPFFASLWAKPAALMVAGVVLGLAIVGGLWWGGVIFGGTQTADGFASEDPHVDQFQISSDARIRQLQQIVEARPDDLDALFELAETHMTNESWNEAIFWFSKFLELSPDNIHAHIDIGTANMNLGQFGEAEVIFEKVLDMDPTNVQAHYNKGFLLAFRPDVPDMDTAVDHWQKVITLDPESDLAEVAKVHIEQFGGGGTEAAVGKE